MRPARHPLAGRQVLLLLGISFCSGLSMGYFSPLLTALMTQRGDSEVAVGLVGTVYYLLVAAGALLAAAGPLRGRGAVSLALALAGGFGLAAPFTRGVLELGLARAGGGLAVGVYSTGVQAALLGRSTERTRGVLTAAQALSFGFGVAVGPLLGAVLYPSSPRLAFAAGGLLLIAMAGVAQVGLLDQGTPPERLALRSVLRKAHFALTAVFAYGFGEAALLSMYPMSLLQRNHPMTVVAVSCSTFVIGSLLSTLPVALAGDRFGRKRVVAVCNAVGVVATAGLSMAEAPALLVALSFLGGASLGPVYALALSLVRDGVADDEVRSAVASFNMAFSLGCIAGPAMTSFAMRQFGPTAIFAPAVGLFGLVIVHATLHRRRGPGFGGRWEPGPEGAADP